MNIAIILAGGRGKRMGGNIPKQFIEVLGKPIVCYTIEKFENNNQIDYIEIVCLKEYIPFMQELIKKYNYKKIKWIVNGGEDYQKSVLNGINNLKGKINDEDIVLLHSSVSPCVTDEIILDGINTCKEKGNCTSATPIVLLAGSNDDGIKSTQYVDRDKIMLLTSPHCFKFSYVTELYEEAEAKKILNQCDPHTTSLMYLLGRTLYFCKGSQTNIKITTNDDIELFKAYIIMEKNKM